MKLNFKNLPTGSLPYNNIQLCKQMMLRLYENIPFLPALPLIDSTDTIMHRTLCNIPCVTIKDGKILLPENTNDKLELTLIHYDKIYNSCDLSDFNKFSFEAPYMQIYEAMLEKFHPQYTVLELIGPFTLASSVFNRNANLLITDSIYRKFIIQTIVIKALWCIYKVRSISPTTVPIIMFNEDMLFKFGTLKRANENISNFTVTTLLQNVFEKVRKAGGLVGVQSFQKCNWQLVFDTNSVNLISFDAYNNPNNLNILSEGVNRFLAKGGYINWGVVPVMNENAIKTLGIDLMMNRLHDTVEDLISAGVSADSVYNNLTVSVQGNLEKYPILFAEKALIIANQLGKKFCDTSIQ